MNKPLSNPLSLETTNKDNQIVSYFKNPIQNIDPSSEITMVEVSDIIRSDKLNEITKKVRNGSASKNDILPYITPSGSFYNRKESSLKKYSGIICMDADHCNIGLKDTISRDTFLNPIMIFISPSGNGLKIYIKINNSTIDNHLLHFKAISKHLYDAYQLETDQACKDIARACFLCHDPDVYYSTGSIDSEVLLSILTVLPIPTLQDETSSLDVSKLSDNIADNLSFTYPIMPTPPFEEIQMTGIKGTKRRSAYVHEITQQPSDELNRMEVVHNRAVSALKTNGWQQDKKGWTRPGKDPRKGVSAKFNIDPKDGLWKFTNFSENALPFAIRGYTDVGVICLLEFGDDITACIKKLASEYLSPETMPKKVTKKPDQPVKTGLLPIDGMPPFVQEYINNCSEIFNTPRDFWAGAAIISTALGIGDKIQLVGRYNNVPILWMNNIGDVSTGKTEAMDFTLKPFENCDSTAAEIFKSEYLKYEHIESMSVKERRDAGVDRMPEPVCFQYIIKDSTPEALNQVHSINKRGIMISRDELKGWLDDFGRYSKSGEQSNLLSSYNRVRWVTNRKGGGIKSVLDIPKPCILVYGGMQPDLIPTLSADNRADNGFLARFCNVWPDHTDKPRYNKNRVPDDLVKRWEDYVIGLIRIPRADNITLSIEAEDFYKEWYDENCKISNDESSGYLKGVYGKLDIIALRLAIVLYGMNLQNGRLYSKEITGAEMASALDITEYFRTTALKVYHKLFDNPIGTNLKAVIKFLSGLGHSQNKIAEIVGVTQQYVNKVLSK